MKKISFLSFVFLSLVLFSQIVQAQENSEVQSRTMMVMTDKLNVRSAPRLGAKVFDYLYDGDAVSVEVPVGGFEKTEWCKIQSATRFGSLSGVHYSQKYVACRYLGIPVNELVAKVSNAVDQIPLAQNLKAPYVGEVGIWMSDDGHNIYLPNETSGSATLSVDDVEGFKKSFSAVTAAVDKILIDEGFTVNAKNSSKDFLDERFFSPDLSSGLYQRGYQNKDQSVVCLLELNNQDISAFEAPMKGVLSMNFGCTDKYKKLYSQQAPILKSSIQFPGGDKAFISVDYVSGNYSSLSIGAAGAPGGSRAVVKKIKNDFQLLYTTQEPPECSIVKKFKVPVILYGSCYKTYEMPITIGQSYENLKTLHK